MAIEGEYRVGSRVRVQLSSGHIVQATIKAIVDGALGQKLQVVFGKEKAWIRPDKIIEVLPTT